MSGIYIHIPYCSQACHYCDFHFSTNLKTRHELVDCLAREINLQKDFLTTKKLDTIYFGGGTPSILTEEELEVIFESISANFHFDKETEITLEANPEDLTISQLQILKSLGINRLSIGIQSFENRFLQYFNRSHNAEQAVSSVKNAQDIGITNISIDLIYGIPNQSLEHFKLDLTKAIELNTPHISAYCLTIEEDTVFGKWHKQKKLNIADEALTADQFELLMEKLPASGFEHYEISNFAKQGFESQHNSSYWKQKPYLGIGPGAHSYREGQRQYNVTSNPGYIKGIKQNKIPASVELLTAEQKINEFILTQIRTSSGISVLEMKEKYNLDLIKNKENQINSLIGQSLMYLNNDALVLTNKGKLFADKITSDLMF